MATAITLSFTHRYESAIEAGRPPLLLLHGTGGDENDLISLGQMIAPGSALLSPRGKVLEDGMIRFFRRDEDPEKAGSRTNTGMTEPVPSAA